MSLKAVHLIFCSALGLLCFGCATWKLLGYQDTHSNRDLAFGLAALALGVATLVYAVYFLRKLKKISYL
jgi:hypothetical protein